MPDAAHSYARMSDVQKGARAMKPPEYLRVYSHILAGVDVRSMFEIGIHQGGSLRFWRELYGPSLRLIGLDAKAECAEFAPPADEVFIGSQTDNALLDRITAAHGPFDLIIDDGSHRNDHMWNTFAHLFAAVRPGGIYVIEDAYTSYWSHYRGGLRQPDSLVERCKGLVDSMFAPFMGPAYAKHHDIRPQDVPPASNAESVAFHRCGIVEIRKRA